MTADAPQPGYERPYGPGTHYNRGPVDFVNQNAAPPYRSKPDDADEAFKNLTPAQVLKALSRRLVERLTCENAHADVCSACMGTGLMRKRNDTIARLAARVLKLERAIMDTVDLLKEGEDNATEGLGLIACADDAKRLVKAL